MGTMGAQVVLWNMLITIWKATSWKQRVSIHTRHRTTSARLKLKLETLSSPASLRLLDSTLSNLLKPFSSVQFQSVLTPVEPLSSGTKMESLLSGAEPLLTTLFSSLDMVLITVLTIGPSRTLGDQPGERMATSEFSET